MTIKELNDLILQNDLDRIRDIFNKYIDIESIQVAAKQYNPKTHDVYDFSANKRPDKILRTERTTDKGDIVEDITGVAYVNRLSIPVQKKIVLLASAFLGNPDIECHPQQSIEDDALAIHEKIWDDNKLEYKFMKIKNTTMSEKHCAELWYALPAENGYWDEYNTTCPVRFKMKILAHSLGDTLYPVFDIYGDMIAFGRGYTTFESEEQIEHLDIYTADKFYFNKKVGGQWQSNYSNDFVPEFSSDDTQKGIPNPIGKIPVVYYSQPHSEWHDVQEMIDRLEEKISNLADTNDYFDSPILFAEGEVIGFGNKGERGKVLEGRNNAKVSYLTWDQAPESMKMEIDNLIKFIHSYTHTPDISFENLQGLGYFSFIALKTLFMDAHLKASDKETIFGEGVQRRINYLKAALAFYDAKFKTTLKLKISPKFEYFMPKDPVEMISILNAAVSGGIMSSETAIEQNPLLDDAETEKERINAEQQAKQIADQQKLIAATKAKQNGVPVN